MIHRVLNFVGGMLALARLALLGALSRRNRYWRWREHTAFGAFPVSRRERFRAVMEYGRWVYSMRRFR